jgi:hypothetical protein
MDARSVRRSISKGWTLVDQMGIGSSFAKPTSLDVSDAFRDISLADDSRYEEIYQKGIELVHYNFMLTDYSYFQFSWFGKDNVRYVYYPNPFARERSTMGDTQRLRELEEAGWLTHEEYLSILSDYHVVNRDPMIRYEHAEGEYRAFHHPCAHLHIGHPPRGRWCVARVLTPFAFTMLVLKHQYPQEWQLFGEDRMDSTTGNSFETGLIRERQALNEVPFSFFSITERQTFRFD